MKTILFIVILITGGSFLAGPASSRSPLTIEKISADMTIRQVQQGQSVTLKGSLYYLRNGNMVTHFVYPREYMIVANKLGETRLYDPVKNSVIQYQNFLFSTQSSQFYYFFSGRISDMGLTRIGYVQEKTYNDGSLLVTEWKLKTPNKKSAIQHIRIVYDGQRPVYMHYEEAGGRVFRKVFYYNYQQLDAYSFPTTTTEILYEKGDSVVSKTSYTDFRLNERATGGYFDYTIPPNAKIEQ
jgi:outer membrane lipoprotein-sorting protein